MVASGLLLAFLIAVVVENAEELTRPPRRRCCRRRLQRGMHRDTDTVVGQALVALQAEPGARRAVLAIGWQAIAFRVCRGEGWAGNNRVGDERRVGRR
jgi:hypothetical protein